MATKDNKTPLVSTGDTHYKDKEARAMHSKEQGNLRRSLFSDNQSNNEVKHCDCLYILVPWKIYCLHEFMSGVCVYFVRSSRSQFTCMYLTCPKHSVRQLGCTLFV